MRIRTIVAIAALLLVPATLSAQQTTPPAAAPAAESNTQSFNLGWVDFGGRWTTTDGDADRYSRYRDMGDGMFLDKFRSDARNERWLALQVRRGQPGPQGPEVHRRCQSAGEGARVVHVGSDSHADEHHHPDLLQG